MLVIRGFEKINLEDFIYLKFFHIFVSINKRYG